MEIPQELAGLYRHWSWHTVADVVPSASGMVPDAVMEFVRKRMSIWEKKVMGEQAPYTQDSILAQYRFCNILREFDKQTIAFHTLLNPLRDNFSLWLLNMFYCRMVARPETISLAGLLSFDRKENGEVYRRLMVSSRPRFGTPYVFPVSTILKSQTPTRELFITEYLPSAMEEVAKEIEGWERKSVYEGVARIIPIFGYSLIFLWTEVLIDVAYQFPERIDLYGRFPIGPGSLPTMKKINPAIDPSILVEELAALKVDVGVTWKGRPIALSAENWEGIGCEYRKYTNLSQGKGRRRIYVAAKGLGQGFPV